MKVLLVDDDEISRQVLVASLSRVSGVSGVVEAEDGEGPAIGVPMTILINPVIEPQTEELEEGIEACLSVPGLAGVVPRYRQIRYRGVTPTGETPSRPFCDRMA